MKKIIKNILAVAALIMLVLPLSAFANSGDPIDLSIDAPAAKQNDVITVSITVIDNEVDSYTDTLMKASFGSGLTYQSGSFTIDGEVTDDKNFDAIKGSGMSMGNFSLNDSSTVTMKFKVTGTTDQGISAMISGVGGSDASGSATVKVSGSDSPASGGDHPAGGGDHPGSTTTTTSDPSCVVDSTHLDNAKTVLCNPLPDQDLTGFNVRIIKLVLGIAGSLAAVAIVRAGLAMIMADGNEEAITNAKNTITWAIVGMIIALLAYSFVAIIETELKTPIPSTTNQPK